MPARLMQLFRTACGSRARGTAAVEFALVAVPFLALMLFVFELSLDLFTQSALDSALQQAARQLQTGNAQNAKGSGDFINNYLCPDMSGLLSCGSVYVKVERLNPTSTQDYYDYTSGLPQTAAGALDPSGYQGSNFCNSGPSQLLLISAIYVGPTVVGRLMPNASTISYNGQLVHVTLSTVGFVTESYPPAAASQGAAAPC